MFGLGWPEIAVCALVGFFVFGPDRLPGLARDVARNVSNLRKLLDQNTAELKQYLPDGDESGLEALRDLRSLHPRRMLQDALSDEPRQASAPEFVTAAAVVAPSSRPPDFDLDAT